jgi:hypothetical protein
MSNGKHWRGYMVFGADMVQLDFPNMTCDPDFGIVSGQSTAGHTVNGTVRRNGQFTFTMQDPDYNQWKCWGRMSRRHDKIMGCYGYELMEIEDQFKLQIVKDENDDNSLGGYDSAEYDSGSEEESKEEPSASNILKKKIVAGGIKNKNTFETVNLDRVDNEAVAKARAFVNDIIAQGEPWTDPDFPPTQESVGKSGELPEASRTYKWMRASEIFDTP